MIQESKTLKFKIAVEGIEVTQATQFYKSHRHLNASTAEDDQAVPLIAGKPLVLRVYPDVGKPPSRSDEMTVEGELWFRPAGTAEWQRSSRFAGDVTGQPAESICRGDACQTLNFRIPGRFAEKTVDVRTRVWFDLPGPARCYSDWVQQTLVFVRTRPLRLRLYGVHFRGQGLDLAPPTAAEALHTLTYLRKTYPVSRIEVLSYDTIEFSGDFTDKGWHELLLILSRLRAASVSADPHYALLPNGVPNNGCGGFGSGLGVGASYVGNGSAMAQEVGHIFCRRHVPGAGASNIDPNFPSYGGYPNGSIGEYGFDPATGQVYSPAVCHDFMSYHGNYWISPYTYRALLECFAGPSATHGNDPVPSMRDNADYLHLGFSLRDNHRFELTNGMMLPGEAIPSRGYKTNHVIELRDEQNHLLESHDIRSREGHDGDGEELHYLESIPFRSEARRVAFHCCSRHAPVTYEIPGTELKIDFVDPAPGPFGEFWDGVVELQWELTCEKPDRLAFFLRYTCDGGTTWQPVNIGFRWKSCRVDLSRLPGGDDCRFQVIASTILQTATAQTDSFRLRKSPRKAMIAGPKLTRGVHHASTLELTGAVHSPEGFARDADLIWSSNLLGTLGHGSYLTIHDLIPGKHEITLKAPDGLGGWTQDMFVLRVLPKVDIYAHRQTDDE